MRSILEELYTEQYLASEFTFGFEFEFLADEDDEEDVWRIIHRYFPEDKEKDFQDDGSIESDDYDNNSRGYEWPSPPMNVTIENIKRTINMFRELNKKRLYVINDTCGFHVHIGYPKYNNPYQTSIWLIINLILDKQKFSEMLMFRNLMFFSSGYAKVKALKELRDEFEDNLLTLRDSDDIEEAEKNGNFPIKTKQDYLNLISEYFIESNKFELLNMHSQGTLEWRGPRNFIDDDSLVKGFFVDKFFRFILWITNILNSTSITVDNIVITRKEIEDLIKYVPKVQDFNFSRNEKKDRDKYGWGKNPNITGMNRTDKVEMMRKYPYLSHKFIKTPIIDIIEVVHHGRKMPLVIASDLRGVITGEAIICANRIENSVLTDCFIMMRPIQSIGIDDPAVIDRIMASTGHMRGVIGFAYQSVLKNCKISMEGFKIDPTTKVISGDS